MEPIFGRKIQVYSTARDTAGTQTTLWQFLNDRSHDEQIEAIRRETDEDKQKQMKKQLPAATISGTFSPRCREGLLLHSGLICLDLDGKDNPLLVGQWEAVKKDLAQIPQIAYIGLSVRANGLAVIIPMRYPEYHQLHFIQLQEDFMRMGIIIDKSCKDVTRMRIMSKDENAYYNHNASEYTRLKQEEKRTPKPHTFYYNGNDTIERVAQLCATIEREGIDLTSSYDEWFRIGCSLADLGEAGREFYHICSQQNESYNEAECNRKFNNLLATTSKWSIATFFYICHQWNIT